MVRHTGKNKQGQAWESSYSDGFPWQAVSKEAVASRSALLRSTAAFRNSDPVIPSVPFPFQSTWFVKKLNKQQKKRLLSLSHVSFILHHTRVLVSTRTIPLKSLLAKGTSHSHFFKGSSVAF